MPIGPNTRGGAGGLGNVVAGLTANTLIKATGTTVADSRITDSGSGAIVLGATTFSIQDSNASHAITITPGNETGDRALSIPVMGAAAKINISTTTQTATYLQQASADGVLANATNTDSQVSGAVSASHTRSHSITGASDHTSTATTNQVLVGDANGLPVDSDYTEGNLKYLMCMATIG